MDPTYSKESKAEQTLEQLAKEFDNRNPAELLAARGAPAAVEKTFPPTSKLPENAPGAKEKVEFCMFSSKKQQ
ncbi:hypothetical protein GCK72_020443 [Caenorhabditis remanei]|uniref:Uncharacterized protein n=1 Tax=Caenorhabditis remanei TaxID=31234 RepID=A0A6A5GGP8_CAERE|nr:hypothetical protein GCK72_020443 [Caenorhabditis remanei]KAF1753886.1 hypothetical protein GCK72_020443 [Caenorhabditis remanei]